MKIKLIGSLEDEDLLFDEFSTHYLISQHSLGDKVSFKVKVVGLPKPTVTWARESGKPLPEAAKTYFDSINKQYVLKVSLSYKTCENQSNDHWWTVVTLSSHIQGHQLSQCFGIKRHADFMSVQKAFSIGSNYFDGISK